MSELRRIGVNLLYLVPLRGGVGTFSRRLIGAMVAERPGVELVVYAGRDAIDDLRGDQDWADSVRFVASPVTARNKARRIVAELSWLPWRAGRDGVQVLHSHGNTGPIRARVPLVITVHDMLYRRFPSTHPLPVRMGLDLVVPRAARAAARVTVPSEATREDVVSLIGVDPGRVDVIPLGPGRPPGPIASEQELRQELGIGDAPIVLSIAMGFEHKNLKRLLEAFAGVVTSQDAILVQLGATGSAQEQELRDLAAELGISDSVRFILRLDDEMLDSAYRHAALFVHPSLLEGFGLVLLEAMSRGCAVACSDTSSLVEVVGDAAELFDPCSTEQIRDAIMNLLADPQNRAELAARGRERVARFSWEETARATFAALERAVDASGPGA